MTVRADQDGQAINLLSLDARLSLLAGPGPSDQAFALSQVAPGRYEAEFVEPKRPFILVVRDKSGQAVWERPFMRTFGQEFEAVGADWENLNLLARLTGGRIVTAGELPELSRLWQGRGYVDVWVYLLGGSLALVLADWIRRPLARRHRMG